MKVVLSMLIFAIVASAYAAQLESVENILPHLVCKEPDLKVGQLRVLDGCVVQDKRANFEICLVNNGETAYFPRIYFEGGLEEQIQLGNLYEDTSDCFSFKSKMSSAEKVYATVKYIVECEQISTNLHKLVYYGGHVSASLSLPKVAFCESEKLSDVSIERSELTFFEEDLPLRISRYATKSFGNDYTQLKLCVENDFDEVLGDVWVTVRPEDIKFFVNRNRIGDLGYQEDCVNLYAAEPILMGKELTVFIDFFAQDGTKRKHRIDYLL